MEPGGVRGAIIKGYNKEGGSGSLTKKGCARTGWRSYNKEGEGWSKEGAKEL